MPVIRRDLIVAYHLEDEVMKFAERGVTTSEIASNLNNEPLIQSRLGKLRILPADVEKFLAQIQEYKKKAHDQAIVNSPEVKDAAMAIRNQVAGLLVQMERIKTVGDLAIEDFHIQRAKWQADANSDKEFPARYPTEQIASIDRMVKTVISLMNTAKTDDKVQQILRAGKVEIHQGITEEKMFDLLYEVGRVLGHTRDEVTSAFAEARAALITRSKPIDVEADDA